MASLAALVGGGIEYIRQMASDKKREEDTTLLKGRFVPEAYDIDNMSYSLMKKLEVYEARNPEQFLTILIRLDQLLFREKQLILGEIQAQPSDAIKCNMICMELDEYVKQLTKTKEEDPPAMVLGTQELREEIRQFTTHHLNNVYSFVNNATIH